MFCVISLVPGGYSGGDPGGVSGGSRHLAIASINASHAAAMFVFVCLFVHLHFITFHMDRIITDFITFELNFFLHRLLNSQALYFVLHI